MIYKTGCGGGEKGLWSLSPFGLTMAGKAYFFYTGAFSSVLLGESRDGVGCFSLLAGPGLTNRGLF